MLSDDDERKMRAKKEFPNGIEELHDYGRRSLELSKEFLGPHQRVGLKVDLSQKVRIIGKGTFKNAFRMPIWNPEETAVSWWCVKYPNGTLRRWVPDLVLLKEECRIGQAGALIFYEMRKRLREARCDLAVEFNRPIIAPLNVHFHGPGCKQLVTAVASTMVMVEHLMVGNFRHHLGQFGHLASETEPSWLCAAFSHFSYVFSRGRLVVTDVQGTSDRLSDICIHTLDGGSGSGDFGLPGMRCSASVHRCNKYCRALGIQDCSMEAELARSCFGAPFVVESFMQQFSKSIQKGMLYRPFTVPWHQF